MGQPWLRCKEVVSLPEVGGFDPLSSGPHVEVPLGKALNPKLLLEVNLAPCIAAASE